MSIVYDYRGIGVMMKGDDWWTAAPREPEPVETTHVEPPKSKVSEIGRASCRERVSSPV